MADPNPVRVRTTVTANPPLQDRPIIFSAPMVRALIDGHKTMTRRLAWRDGSAAVTPAVRAIKRGAGLASPWQRVQPGDRLWVREVHYVESAGYRDGTGCRVNYRATTPDAPNTWTPSIHMPRWASRITLVVTAVRVERLQAITDADAIAEGLWSRPADFDPRILLWHWEPEGGRVVRAAGWAIPIGAFCNLWERLHGRESWFANPDVVALTFAVHPRNIDQMPA